MVLQRQNAQKWNFVLIKPSMYILLQFVSITNWYRHMSSILEVQIYCGLFSKHEKAVDTSASEKLLPFGSDISLREWNLMEAPSF